MTSKMRDIPRIEAPLCSTDTGFRVPVRQGERAAWRPEAASSRVSELTLVGFYYGSDTKVAALPSMARTPLRQMVTATAKAPSVALRLTPDENNQPVFALMPTWFDPQYQTRPLYEVARPYDISRGLKPHGQPGIFGPLDSGNTADLSNVDLTEFVDAFGVSSFSEVPVIDMMERQDRRRSNPIILTSKDFTPLRKATVEANSLTFSDSEPLLEGIR